MDWISKIQYDISVLFCRKSYEIGENDKKYGEFSEFYYNQFPKSAKIVLDFPTFAPHKN